MDSKLNMLQEPTCAPSQQPLDANIWSDENNLRVMRFCQNSITSYDCKGEMKKSFGPPEIFDTNCDHDKCQRTIVFWNIPYSMTIEHLLDHFRKFGEVCTEDFQYYNRDRKHLRKVKIEFLEVSTAQRVVSYAERHKFYSRSSDKTPNPNEKHVNKQNGEDKDECFFNNLPDELINYIFSYLDYSERIRVERVCKRWQYVNTKVTWIDMHSLKFLDKFNLNNQRTVTTDILISILKRCGMTLRDINFDSCNHDLTNDLPTDISTYCPNLESVNLSNTSVSSDSLKNLVVACENLQTVILRNCYGLTDNSLQHVLKEGKNIKFLDISQNLNVTGKCFNHVKDGLETLILNECERLIYDDFRQLQNKRIKCLSLNDCSGVNVKTLAAVVKSLKPTLTELNLKKAFRMCLREPRAIQTLLDHCENLQCLCLEDNYFVDDDSVRFISCKCLQLRCLNISGNKLLDDSIRTLRKLSHLRELYLNYSETMTDISLFDLSSNDQLERVELRGCYLIGNGGCRALLGNCRKLKLLDISDCRNITDELVDEANALEREDKIKLEIIAGGSNITNFIDNDFVRVSSENLCPLAYRRAMSDDEEFDGECGGFVGGDLACEYDYDLYYEAVTEFNRRLAEEAEKSKNVAEEFENWDDFPYDCYDPVFF